MQRATIFRSFIPAGFLVLAAALSSSAFAADNSSSATKPIDITGSRPASTGSGFSIYRANSMNSDTTYHIECTCSDQSLVTTTCSSNRYQCNCTPKATLSCN